MSFGDSYKATIGYLEGETIKNSSYGNIIYLYGNAKNIVLI